MRAIVYDRFGPASDVLELKDIPTPSPAPGEVLVRLHASGVNPSDIRLRAGGRPGMTEPPFPQIIPHSDGAGIIEAVGEGVPPSRIGERVWVWNGQWQRAFGTAAGYIALPAAQAVPMADHVTFEQGAILGIPGFTAIHTVLGGGPVEGMRVLVSGGAGAVGRLAVQCAAASGAHVIATCSERDIDAVRGAGAAHVFDYRSPTLADDILDATGGKLIERIVEVEFGQNAETNAKVIAERGTICSYGSAKEMTPAIPFYPFMFKAITIDLALIYLLSDQERADAVQNLNLLLDKNALNFAISHTLPLDQCAKAHEFIEAGERSGSVILQM